MKKQLLLEELFASIGMTSVESTRWTNSRGESYWASLDLQCVSNDTLHLLIAGIRDPGTRPCIGKVAIDYDSDGSENGAHCTICGAVDYQCSNRGNDVVIFHQWKERK